MADQGSVSEAIKGLVDWSGIQKLVEAFNGGWEAVVALAIIFVCITFIICFVCLVGYWSHKSSNDTKVEILRVRKRLGNGGDT